MIRQLTEHDHEKVLCFLKKDPSFNLFILGDIEAFGYKTDFQKLWGEWDSEDLKAVLLRFHDSYIMSAIAEFDVDGFTELLPKNEKVALSGKAEVVELFEGKSQLKLGEKRTFFFAECTEETEEAGNLDNEVKIASLEDIDRIIDLRSSISEFRVTEASRKLLVQAMEEGTGRTFYIERNGKMAASSSTSAENSISAMVVGVCTHPDFRNKGYASDTLKALVQEVLGKDKKSLCLFYDNPKAGSIYHRLGFADIGHWTIYR
ncbi:GNAT family N-acetyltransferase [Peribacillus kribbensis]|uniref:GNAT family N-acetyltransferase n=1 Tax=Peribacillus kribbensis TaxID=356658 RepID=UPI00042757B5|nr:GNAT family N-acetyltransferase [Peribacillus kribbensis]